MKVSRDIIANLCVRFGAAVKAPQGIDGARLLWALAGNESGFGANCAPRHESGYCRTGKYFDRDLTALWGCLAHHSCGPWQVMYPNISKGNISPLDAMSAAHPEIGANAVVVLLNGRIFGTEKATTIEQVADAYNSGDWRDQVMPEEYVAELVKNYAVPIGDWGSSR